MEIALYDGASARFRHGPCLKGWWGPSSVAEYGYLMTGSVNGKNLYGNYVGYSPYMALIRNGTVRRHCLNCAPCAHNACLSALVGYAMIAPDADGSNMVISLPEVPLPDVSDYTQGSCPMLIRTLILLQGVFLQACAILDEPDDSTAGSGETFSGLVIADENRCSVYESCDNSYPQSVEDDIIDAQDGLFSPNVLQCYLSKSQTDIEHIVARSEAHDSGLCSASDSTRRAFARYLQSHALTAQSQSLREGRS